MVGRNVQRKTNGFTIVELLVIVGVIAILAGIVAFSFGQWRAGTARTEVQNDLKAFATAMENERNFQNAYPTSVPSSFTASENVTVTLESATSTAYCAEGSSKVVSGVVYKVQNGSTDPVAGSC